MDWSVNSKGFVRISRWPIAVLLDPVPYLWVDVGVAPQVAVADTGGLGIDRAGEDHTLRWRNGLIARCPPRRITRITRRFVHRIQRIQKCRVGAHLDARYYRADVRDSRPVIG